VVEPPVLVGVVVVPVADDVPDVVGVGVGSGGAIVDADDDVASVVAVAPVELESELEEFWEVSADAEESGDVTTASDMLLVEYESAAGVGSGAAETESVVEPASAEAASAAAGAPESAGLASVAAGAGAAAAGAAGGGAPKFGGSDPTLLSTVGAVAAAGSGVCAPVKLPCPEVAAVPPPPAGAAAAP
jgi:hypothetical protein